MSRYTLQSFVTLCCALTCFATTIERIPIKQKGAGPLFQIHYGPKWGFIDRHGALMIPPQFDDVSDFFSGLAAVEVGGKWGYVDERGQFVIPPRFDRAGHFTDRLAP